MRAQFDEFCLDRSHHELTRAGEAVSLPAGGLELLAYLMERRPRLIPDTELFDHLWPHSLPDTTRVRRLVAEIRAALHDHGHYIIRSVYGRGHAFGRRFTILDEARASRCQLLIGESRFDLRQGENVIGRDNTATVRIESPCVSRRHAILTVDDDHATVADLGSRNGTFVGARRARSTTPLADGDRIQFGCAVATFAVRIEEARPQPGVFG